MTPQQRAALRIGLITFVLTSLLVLVVLVNYDVLAFAHIGTRFSEGDPDGTVGYDGQFVYFIARDGAGAVPYIDGPTLRYQRIVLPLIGRALALGNPDWVPWTLLLTNIVAHTVGAGLLAYLLAGMGAPAWGALIYSLWIGNLFALRFNLTEPLCFALALAAIIAYRDRRYRWTIFLLILSTLTKELGAVFAAGLALHAAVTRRQISWSVLIFGGPVLAFLSWWGVMRLWLGAFPTQYPAAHLHMIPLEGMFTILAEDSPVEDLAARTVQFALALIFLGLPTVVLLLAALRSVWQRHTVLMTTALLLGGAGFVMVMPDVSWQDPVAVYRVGMPVVIGGILFAAETDPGRLRLLATLWFPATIVALMIPGLWF